MLMFLHILFMILIVGFCYFWARRNKRFEYPTHLSVQI